MSRQDFYENAVYSLSEEDFERIFGVKPLDIMDFDYSFDEVIWNANLEFAYQDCISE